MISNTSVTTTRKGSLELNAADIVDLLRKAGHEIPLVAGAAGLRVYFAVPGGGDYSNTDVDITDSSPVRLEWETRDAR